MAININMKWLEKDFTIYGVIKSTKGLIVLPFEKKKTYFGFLVRKKY